MGREKSFSSLWSGDATYKSLGLALFNAKYTTAETLKHTFSQGSTVVIIIFPNLPIFPSMLVPYWLIQNHICFSFMDCIAMSRCRSQHFSHRKVCLLESWLYIIVIDITSDLARAKLASIVKATTGGEGRCFDAVAFILNYRETYFH